MTTRARWDLDLVLDDGVDVADDPDSTPVFLLEDVATLQARLVTSLKRTKTLHKQGVTCDLMFSEGVTCSACPLRRSASDDPMTALCKTGVEVEAVQTSIAIHASGMAPG